MRLALKSTEKNEDGNTKKKRIAQGAAVAGTAGLLTGVGEAVRRRRSRSRTKALRSRLRLGK